MTKFNFNMSYEDIDKGIKSVNNRGTKLRDDIHALCISILSRWLEDGNVQVPRDKATALLTHVDGYHAQALVNWFKAYAGFDWDKEAKVFVYSKDKTTITLEEAKAAKAEPYYELTPPKAPEKAFDLPTLVQTLIARAEKKREKGLKDGDNASDEMIQKLKAVLAA